VKKVIGGTVLRGIATAALFLCVCAAGSAQTWERVGPEGGNVLSLATAGDGTVFLGTADGHVFASQGGGGRWELRGRVGTRTDAVVQKIVVDVKSRSTLYAAVWTQDPVAGGGVYRSVDGGKTWEKAGLQGEAVRALAQPASNPEIFVAGTRTGVFLTSDAGKNWTRISPARDEEIRNLDSIAIDPRDARVIYAGTYHLPWKTADGGKNWTAIAAGMIDDSDIMSVEIDRTNATRVFASACSGIYRSENGGAQWTKLQGIPYASRRTQQIAQDSRDAAVWYAGTTEGLWRSGDAGENWTRMTPREVIVNAIAFAEGGQKLILGTEDGIRSSRDSGKSFVEQNAGFSHRVLSAFAANAAAPEHLLAAADTPGKDLFESLDGGKNWRRTAGPGRELRALFSIGDSWFAALREGGAAQFDKRSGRWKEVRFVAAALLRESKRQVSRPSRVMRPVVNNVATAGGRVFVATSDGLWVSSLRSGAFQRMAERQIAGKIGDIAANDAGTELFAIARGSIVRSIDAGKSWEPASVPPRAGEPLWISAENRGAGTLLVGAANGVWEYAYGTEWGGTGGWRAVQAGLPAAASWRAWIGEEFWMIPMRSGSAYLSRDAGHTWDRIGNDETGSVLAVAGKGLGVWGMTRTEGVVRWGGERKKPGNSQVGTSHRPILGTSSQD